MHACCRCRCIKYVSVFLLNAVPVSTKLLCGLEGSGRYFMLVYIIPTAMKAAIKLFSKLSLVTQVYTKTSVSPFTAAPFLYLPVELFKQSSHVFFLVFELLVF